jgi:hypothetical protein
MIIKIIIHSQIQKKTNDLNMQVTVLENIDLNLILKFLKSTVKWGI